MLDLHSQTMAPVAPVNNYPTPHGNYKTTTLISDEAADIGVTALVSWLPLTLNFPLSRKHAVAPNVLLRGLFSSLLYTGRMAKRAIDSDLKPLFRTTDFEIWQTAGERLDQGDADVYFGLIKRAMLEEATSGKILLKFDAKEFLQGILREATQGDKNWLNRSFNRMVSATFTIVFLAGKRRPKSEFVYFRPLDSISSEVPEGENATTRYNAIIDTGLARLFEDGWSLLDLDLRRELRGRPLAQWLLNFYVTHKIPTPYGHLKLKKYSGRAGMQNSKWITTLAAAVENLKAVTQWHTCELDTSSTLIIGKDPKVPALRPYDVSKYATAIATPTVTKPAGLQTSAKTTCEMSWTNARSFAAEMFASMSLENVLALLNQDELETYNALCARVTGLDDAHRHLIAVDRIKDRHNARLHAIALEAKEIEKDMWNLRDEVRRHELAILLAGPIDENEVL